MNKSLMWCLVLAGGCSTSYSQEPSDLEKPTATPPQVAPEQLAAARELGVPVQITNSIGMKLVLIPAGEFLMGSDSSRWSHEQPQHKVRIAKPFYLGVYEVTQAEYEKVMGKNPSWFSKGGSRASHLSGEDTSGHPVENVSWEEAVEFCERLSAKDGKMYRLPSEAEWEYACGAGTTTKWYCGDKEDELGRVAWYLDNSRGMTHPVGGKEGNAWGLFNMHGNVREWCQDGWGRYSSDETIHLTGSSDVALRVYRGGSWCNLAGFCRSAYRFRRDPRGRDGALGFRMAAVPSGSAGKSSK